MKTMMKRIAMFTLSACMLAGGAVSSFLPPAHSSHYTAAILSHQTGRLRGHRKRRSSLSGSAAPMATSRTTSSARRVRRRQRHESGLQEVNNAVANFSKLYVYQGKLDNGERVMTVSCLSSGASAMSGVTANVMLPWSARRGL